MLFPLNDSDLIIWLNQFARTLDKYSTLLGVTPREVTGIKSDAAMLHYIVGVDLPTYETALSTRKAYKQLVKYGPIGEPVYHFPVAPLVLDPPSEVEPGIVPRLYQMVLRLESSPNYTEALAHEFGFVGYKRESELEPVIARPTGRAVGQPDNEVRVEFSKCAFDGVLIESRRTGHDEWRRLATDSLSPYIDSRPLSRAGKPEVREYRMRFLMSDVPVGEWSEILVATASV